MMNIINAKDIAPGHLTVLIYGTPGMGKTTLLGNLKGRTLILDADKGTSVLAGKTNVDVLRMSENFKEIPEAIRELKANCSYDNICLDSLSELERSILTRLASVNNSGVPTLQDYGKVNHSMLNLCRQLRELDANIFFTAWEKYTEIIAPSGEKYTRIEPFIRDKNMENVCGLCDIVGRVEIERDSEERIVCLEGSPCKIAKDRIYKRQKCSFKELIPVEERGDKD